MTISLNPVNSQDLRVELSKALYFFYLLTGDSQLGDSYTGSALVTDLTVSYKFKTITKLNFYARSGVSRHMVNTWFAGGRPFYINLGLGIDYPIWKDKVFYISDITGYVLLKKFRSISIQRRVYSTANLGFQWENRKLYYFI